MIVNRPGVVLAFVVACMAGPLAAPVWAAPWNQLFSKVDADPEKTYVLAEGHGPWMIMAASFSGERSEEQARELVLELRRKHKVNAYLYDKVFDYSGYMPGLGVDPEGNQKRVRYRRAAFNERVNGRSSQFREIAVLAGDFTDVDDPAAQKFLQKLKYAQFDCLKPVEGRADTRSLGLLREVQRQINEMAGQKEKALKGPLGSAFITTNPLLPDEYFVPKGLEKLVIEMNAPVKHSLLKCPGKYSVKVATFTARVIVDPKAIKAAQSGKVEKSELAEAAAKAHSLTEVLRERGYEAYEFHDRHSSIVCVGSFDSLGSKLADGKVDVDARIRKILETFSPAVSAVPGQSVANVGRPKELKDFIAGRSNLDENVKRIRFDLQPLVVEVPQRSIANDYERTAWRQNP